MTMQVVGRLLSLSSPLSGLNDDAGGGMVINDNAGGGGGGCRWS